MTSKFKLFSIASASVLLGAVLIAPEAKAGCALDALASCTITQGDKTISNITLTGFTPTSAQTLDFSIASGAWVVSTSFAPNQSLTVNKTFTLAYTVTITDPTQNFFKFQVQGDDTTINGGNTSQVVTVTGIPSPATSNNGSTANASFVNPPQVINVSSVSTTSGGASFNNISQKFTQTPASSVPSPLPILGASVAFSMSRRLRQRISLAS